MPLINLRTSLASLDNKEQLLLELKVVVVFAYDRVLLCRAYLGQRAEMHPARPTQHHTADDSLIRGRA